MMVDNVFASLSCREVTLADGKAYKLSPFDLTTQAELETAFECTLSKVMGKLKEREALNTRLLVFILIKENHPELTLKSLGRLITFKTLPGIMETIRQLIADME